MHPRASTLSRTLLTAFAIAAGGCAHRRNAIPADLLLSAEIVGFPDVRGWEDKPDSIKQSLAQAVRQGLEPGSAGGPDPDGKYSLLSISGGGPNGAFGAGLLCGWSESGGRPSFKLVTGISTGALIAPFAFLGPQYDAVLKRFYTTVCTKDILRIRSPMEVLFGAQSVADTAPLARLLEQCVDQKLLDAVAGEHRKGRRLLIGTTHLDAGRLVVWDMGAIAASGRPDALALFRKVMRASAAIPIAFPPEYFQVQAGGRAYDELHVDGGVLAQAFITGVALDVDELRRAAGHSDPVLGRLFVIRNGQVLMPAKSVEPRLLGVAERAVSGFIDSQAVGDLYRLYAYGVRDGLEFNLAVIPADFDLAGQELFDRQVMNRLFEVGYRMGREGYPWERTPPGLEPPHSQ